MIQEKSANVLIAKPGTGHSAETFADLAVNKLMHVGENAHPAIREQAIAYKEEMRRIITYYIKEAIRSHDAYRK